MLSEYVGDTLLILNDRNMKSRKEAMWKLVDKLYEAFIYQNSSGHDLFKGTSQNNEQGFKRLFECYDIGKERLHDIYKQDIEKSKTRITIGRRKHNIETNTIAQQKKKQEKKIKVNSTNSITYSRKRQKFQETEINEQCHGNMQECKVT